MSNEANFTATVSKWVEETPQRLTAVMRESTQRTVSEAQANVPVDTGFLRASVRASLEAMPPQQETPGHVEGRAPHSGPLFSYDGSDVVLTIANAKLDDTIYIGWTANYAAFVEFGTSRMAPRAFLRSAAEQWPQTVKQVSEELKSRAGGSTP